MSRAIWILLGMAIVGAGAVAQQWPDIGTLMRQSRDYVNVQSGCALKYNSTTLQFDCAIGGGSVAVVTGTLTRGTRTTVSAPTATVASLVQCDCGGTGGTLAGTTCRELGAMRVASVTTGSLVLAHGYAVGGETVVCAVEG